MECDSLQVELGVKDNVFGLPPLLIGLLASAKPRAMAELLLFEPKESFAVLDRRESGNAELDVDGKRRPSMRASCSSSASNKLDFIGSTINAAARRRRVWCTLLLLSGYILRRSKCICESFAASARPGRASGSKVANALGSFKD